MAVTDLSDIRKKRRTKKMQRFLNKLIVILLAVMVILVLYITKGKWYPKLDGILTKIPTTASTGELAEENYPIKINGGASYQVKPMAGHFAVVDDSHINIYDIEGKQVLADQHTYANPILTTSDKKVLVYDLGGKNFCLYSKFSQVYKKETDDVILLGKLSPDDHVAIVTKSDKFLSCLNIYDSKGSVIFVYKSYDSRIIDVTFNSNNSGCYITTIGANGGQLVSQMMYYEFTKKDVIWTSEQNYTMGLSTRLMGDTNLVMFGDTSCTYYDITGTLCGQYKYDHKLVDFDSSSTLSAILYKNTEVRKSSLTIISDISSPVEIELEDPADKVCVYNDMVYVLDSSNIYAYSQNGELVSSIRLDTDYENFCKIDKNILLMGYDEINRIEYS